MNHVQHTDIGCNGVYAGNCPPNPKGQEQDNHGTTFHNNPYYAAIKAQYKALQKLQKTITGKHPVLIELDENYLEKEFV